MLAGWLLTVVAGLVQEGDPSKWVEALDGEHQAQAMEALLRGGAASVPALIEGLDSDAPRIRGGAARTLGRMGPVARPAVVALARALLEHDPDEESTRTISDALVNLGRESRSAVAPLIRQLEDSGAAIPARFVAAWTLGGMSRELDASTRGLLRTLDSKPPTELELFVVVALARGGSSAARELRTELTKTLTEFGRLRSIGLLVALGTCLLESGSTGKDISSHLEDPMLRPAVVHTLDVVGGKARKTLRVQMERLLKQSLPDTGVHSAVYALEHPVDLEESLEMLRFDVGERRGLLPRTLRWTNLNRIEGVTPASATTAGDIIEGLAESLTVRWSELALRWSREPLPSVSVVRSELEPPAVLFDALRIVPNTAYWSPGSDDRRRTRRVRRLPAKASPAPNSRSASRPASAAMRLATTRAVAPGDSTRRRGRIRYSHESMEGTSCRRQLAPRSPVQSRGVRIRSRARPRSRPRPPRRA